MSLTDPEAIAVEDRLYDALAVLRVAVTINMLGLNWWRRDNYDYPLAALSIVLILVAWTGIALFCYDRPAWRKAPLLLVDLMMALVAIGLTPWLKGHDFNATLPGFWVMGALLAWAVHWHWAGGLAAAMALTGADLLVRTELTQTNYGNIFLLMLGGPIVGYLCESLQRSASQRAAAERVAAAAQERTRLARAVHDGVLQVLSLVQRRGAELGGDFAELARLAGEQEASLRALIHQQDSLVERADPRRQSDSPIDLGAAAESLVGYAGLRVTVATPGQPVPLAASVATELMAAVRACLDNVQQHVGPGAAGWVLVEDLGDQVSVTVRDEGGGIPTGRLDEARAAGRLGVSQSICGRLADLGGEADLFTGPTGTEWELRVPRTPVGSAS